MFDNILDLGTDMKNSEVGNNFHNYSTFNRLFIITNKVRTHLVLNSSELGE